MARESDCEAFGLSFDQADGCVKALDVLNPWVVL